MSTKETKKRIRTTGAAFDYIWEHQWKLQKAAGTQAINRDHVLDYCGKSFPLNNWEEGWAWDELRNHYRKKKPFAEASTINRVTASIQAAINFCNGRGLTTVTPSREGAKKLKETKKRHDYFTREEVAEFSRIAREFYCNLPLSRAITISAYTGMRQAELLRLRTIDIDFEYTRPTIWVGGKPGVDTKNSEYREVTMFNDQLLAACRGLVTDQPTPEKRVLYPHYVKGKGLLHDFREVLETYGGKYENRSEHYYWHTLRHTFASWAGETQSPATIAAYGGWKDVSQVVRYCHATDEARNALASSL